MVGVYLLLERAIHIKRQRLIQGCVCAQDEEILEEAAVTRLAACREHESGGLRAQVLQRGE